MMGKNRLYGYNSFIRKLFNLLGLCDGGVPLTVLSSAPISEVSPRRRPSASVGTSDGEILSSNGEPRFGTPKVPMRSVKVRSIFGSPYVCVRTAPLSGDLEHSDGGAAVPVVLPSSIRL